MKHLIVGDIHGFHHNLRKFLLAHGVINKRGEAINRDEFKVYSVGDLIDGEVNQQGDWLNLEYASEWFDGVCIGNHEYAFLGGKEFGGRRKHDRMTQRNILRLIDEGVYVPSILAGGYLVTHAGLSDEFPFVDAEDAQEYISRLWNKAPDATGDIGVFDWTSNYSNHCCGIFNLDWTDDRNSHFPQVVGHTTYYTGPILKEYDNGISHWNVDAGAKVGKGVSGIVIDDVTGVVTPLYTGSRNLDTTKVKKLYPPSGDTMMVPLDNRSTPKQDKLPLILGARTPVGSEDFLDGIMDLTTEIAESYISDGGKSLYWHDLDLSNLEDVYIKVLDDPEILTAYKSQLNGQDPFHLKDYFPEIAFH